MADTQIFFGLPRETLEEKITQIVTRVQSPENQVVHPRKEDIMKFGIVSGDFNPIHLLPERAIKYGFKDTPFMGAHTASYAYHFGEMILRGLQEEDWGKNLKIIGQSTTFKTPVLPGDTLVWKVKERGYSFDRNNDRQDNPLEKVKISFTGSVKREEKDVDPTKPLAEALDVEIRLGEKYNVMPQIAGAEFWNRSDIEPEEIPLYYECVGQTNKGIIPHIYAAAFIPPALLRLQKERTGRKEGANLAFDLDFLNEAKAGSIKVEIYPGKAPREMRDKLDKTKILGYYHSLKVVCSQDTIPLNYGNVNVLAPMPIRV